MISPRTPSSLLPTFFVSVALVFTGCSDDSGADSNSGQDATSSGDGDGDGDPSGDGDGDGDPSGDGDGEPSSCAGGSLEGPLMIDSDAALAELVGVTQINGNIFLSGSISSLEPLSCLAQVNGVFSIDGAADLTELAGLGATEVSESLTLRNLPALTSLAGIEAMRPERIGLAQLPIDSLEPLADMAGELSFVTLSQLESLTSLAGLEAVTSLETLAIDFTPLTDISALSGLTEISDNLSLRFIEVADLAPLGGLTYVGHIVVRDSMTLADLSGLDGVETTELYLDALPNVSTAPAVTFVDTGEPQDYSLFLLELPALTSLGGLTAPATLPGGVSLLELPALTSIAELSALTTIGGLGLSEIDTVDLSAFAQLESINGGLSVSQLATTDLSFLPSLVTVAGDLSITFNNDLSDVSELYDVVFLGDDASVKYNDSLRTGCIDDLETALEANGFDATWDVADNGPNLPCE